MLLQNVINAKTFLKTCIMEVDDASFPNLINQISCLLLHYLHECNCSLAVCSLAVLVCSMMYTTNGQVGDSQDRKK